MLKNGRQYTPKSVRLPAGGGWEVLAIASSLTFHLEAYGAGRTATC
jgi:hypothetical protein